MSKNIVLFSGGVDSLTTVLMLKKRDVSFSCVYVDFSHKYVDAEKYVINCFVYDLDIMVDVLSMNGIGQFESNDAEIPLRNLFLVEAGVLFGGGNIYLSVEEGAFENKSRDRSLEFMDRVAVLLTWMKRDNVWVHNLVGKMTKEDEMRWILENIDRGKRLLLNTFSCFTPMFSEGVFRMCGNCSACIRWWLAGIGVGLKRMDWVTEPMYSSKFQEYLEGEKTGKYDGRRGEQYRRVFQKIGVL